MSIFASLPAPDDTDHEDGCAVYVETEPGCFEFSGNPCDCGQPGAPLAYQGSHILPADTDERGGTVDLAAVPRDDDNPEPFLRLGVHAPDGTVILTRRNVQQIHDTLGWWLKATA